MKERVVSLRLQVAGRMALTVVYVYAPNGGSEFPPLLGVAEWCPGRDTP